MKNIILPLFLLISFSIYSQDSTPEYIFGVKGGSTASTFIGEVSYGVHFGVVIQKVLDQRSMLLGEILFNQKYSSYLNLDNASIKSRLDYIDFPISGRYYLLKNLSLEAGPQIGILINSKNELGYPNPSTPHEIIELEILKKFAVSGNLGFNYNLSRSVLIGIRGSYVISEIYDYESKTEPLTNILSVQASIHYYF